MEVNTHDSFNFIHYIPNSQDIVDPYEHVGKSKYYICPNLLNRQLAYANDMVENENQQQPQQAFQQPFNQNTFSNNNVKPVNNQVPAITQNRQVPISQPPPQPFNPPFQQPPFTQIPPQQVQPPLQQQQEQYQQQVQKPPSPPPAKINPKPKKVIVKHRRKFSTSSSSSDEEDTKPKPKIEDNNNHNNNYNDNHHNNNHNNNNNNNNGRVSIPSNAVCKVCNMSKTELEEIGCRIAKLNCEHYICSMCAKEFCRENHDNKYNYFCSKCGKNKGSFTLDELKKRGVLDDLDIQDLQRQ